MESNVLRRKAARKASSWPPDDLLYEIFSRLPAKSIGRFRCLSKSCAAMIRGKDFTNLYLTRSCARHQLLLVCCNRHDNNRDDNVLSFFSAPQPQSLESLDKKLSLEDATRRLEIPLPDHLDRENSHMAHVGGLVYYRDFHKGKKAEELVTTVCNPTTRESILLPMNVNKRTKLRTFMGYDPIGGTFKVLSMALRKGVNVEHRVITLQSGSAESWEEVECSTVHVPRDDVICMKGVLYYAASDKGKSRISMIACFDLRTETYLRFIPLQAVTSVLNPTSTLINYHGSLALITMQGKGPSHWGINRSSTRFVMCVLQDTNTHKWSTQPYDLPTQWQNVVGPSFLKFVGITAADEIVLSTPNPSYGVVYVFYYSFEKKSIRKVGMRGMDPTKYDKVYSFSNYVDNFSSMQD